MIMMNLVLRYKDKCAFVTEFVCKAGILVNLLCHNSSSSVNLTKQTGYYTVIPHWLKRKSFYNDGWLLVTMHYNCSLKTMRIIRRKVIEIRQIQCWMNYIERIHFNDTIWAVVFKWEVFCLNILILNVRIHWIKVWFVLYSYADSGRSVC